MQETSIYEYYVFGYNYYLLQNLTSERPIHGETPSLIHLIDEFLLNLRELSLEVTRQAATELLVLRERIGSLPKDAKVDAALAMQIRSAVNTIDATLDAELSLRSAFVVTPKRFHVDRLLKTTKGLFAESVFEKLPDICQFDFREAGRCIAFGMPTAAAFHTMRGTEGVLRHYYCSIVKRDRVKKFLWYEMLNHLRNRRDPPPKSLIGNLDNIRVNFRNPTQHPDARYDMDEAQDLLALCIDVVNRMIRPKR